MPYRQEWVDPKVFYEYNGVTVYHTYEDDDIYFTHRYKFTLNADAFHDSGEDEGVFDIREYGNRNGHDLETDEGQKARMRELIDAGVLAGDCVWPDFLEEGK